MKISNCAAILACSLVACGGGSKNSAGPKDIDRSGSGDGSSAVIAPPPPACTDEGAGRDFASAMALAAGEFAGCTNTDPDVYSVLSPDHPAGTLYEVRIKAASAVVATIFDQDQHELGAATVASGQETSLHVVLATNSRMFLRVVGDGPQVMPYTITTKASPLTDEDEPNDTVEQASPLNLDKTRTALLQTAANNKNGSADYYRVLLGRDGTLRATVEAGTDEVSLVVEMFDKAGKRIGESTAANPGAAVTVEARVKRGDYFIKVAANGETPVRAFAAGAPGRYLQNGYRITVTKK